MAAADEESDEYDHIDDPIKLIYFEQNTLDDCNNNSEEYLRKSALATYPIVSIVDCEKYPWYYKRCKSQHTVSISEIIELDDDDDIIIVNDDYCNIQVSEPVTVNSAECNPTKVQPTGTTKQEMSATTAKPKIRPVNIADYNIGPAKSFVERNKQSSPKTISNKDTKKQTLKLNQNAVVTPPLIDFKRNLVVGLKIVNKVATVASKSRSKIKDLFGDDDIEIPIKVRKHTAKQSNEANSKNETKNSKNSDFLSKKMVSFSDTGKVIGVQKSANNVTPFTSKQGTSEGVPDPFRNKLILGSKVSPQSTSIQDSSNVPKTDSKSKPEKKITDSAIEINNASLKFTITRKNIDEYYLSINNDEEHKKSKKKEKKLKKHGDTIKSEIVKNHSKRDNISSRDKIKFKREKKVKDGINTKQDSSQNKHKRKLIQKESINIVKEMEKEKIIKRKETEDCGDRLKKAKQLNGVKYIVHSSKQEVNAVNPEKSQAMDKFQDSTYLNEKVVDDLISLQPYVDDYVNPKITVSNTTDITKETVTSRANNGTPIQATITISYVETHSNLTITEQSKHSHLEYSAPQQRSQEITSPVVQRQLITDPKIASQVSSLTKNDHKSEQTSILFNERPLQAKHKSISQTSNNKSSNISKSPPPLCNVKPLRNSINGSSKPLSSPNCKDLSMPSLSPDPEKIPPMDNTIIDTNANTEVQIQPVEKDFDQNDKTCNSKSGGDAKRCNNTVQNKKEELTQIVSAKTAFSYENSKKNVSNENQQKIDKTSTATTVYGKEQIQTDNIKELEKVKKSIQANVKELKKMKHSTQLTIQEQIQGPVQNEAVNHNLPNNTPPTNNSNRNFDQNQNRFNVQYSNDNYFHDGFGSRGPVNPQIFPGPGIHRAPPPWLHQSMEPGPRYPMRMPKRNRFYRPQNTPKYRPYNGMRPTGLMPRMPATRQPLLDTPMLPRPTSLPFSTPMPIHDQMMPPMQTDMIPHAPTPTMPNYPACYTPMPTEMLPPMSTSQYSTMVPRLPMPTSQPSNVQIPHAPTPTMPNYPPCYTPMPTEMLPPMPTSQYSTMMPRMPMPTSQPSNVPIPHTPTSGPYSNIMPIDMMFPMSKTGPSCTSMPPAPDFRTCDAPILTGMLQPTSQLSDNRMENHFMPPLPAYRPRNTPMPPMPNSRHCNTPMPPQTVPQIPTTPDLSSWINEVPSMSMSRPSDTPTIPTYMTPQMNRPLTSNTQTPSNMARPQPPSTPMTKNIPNIHPPSTTIPSDINSSIQAKTWNIPPAYKYVRCSPLYETQPLNMFNPPAYEQNSSTNQSMPYNLPISQAPGSNGLTPPPPPAQTPAQGENNLNMHDNNSTDDSVIGRNPDDGNLIRRIALSMPNPSTVVNFVNNESTQYHTSASIVGCNDSWSSQITTRNESGARTVIASHKTPESDTPINSKSEMLIELCKAVGIEETPIATTPTKDTLKRPAVAANSAHLCIPKNRKLSLSACIATESQNKNNVQVSQCGYSPPILPIPTHEKTFELLSQTSLFSENDISVAMPNITDKPTRSNENMPNPDRLSTNQTINKNNAITETSIETAVISGNEEIEKVKSVRRISLEEYKKRVPLSDETLMNIKTEIKSECPSPSSNQDGVIDNIGAIRQSTESDLGYDSDSTVRL